MRKQGEYYLEIRQRVKSLTIAYRTKSC